jgi:hypothetical protein
MKVLHLVIACSFLLLYGGDLKADPPNFSFDGKLESGGNPISMTCPVPTVADWNNDGRKDLIIGDFYYGNIYLFLNDGTNLNPVFNGSTKIESNGSPITTTYG